MGSWVDIRSDYVDDTDVDKGIVTLYIDAWRTDDDNEEGHSIATITLDQTETIPLLKIIYKRNDIEHDPAVQEAIRDGIQHLKEYYLKEATNK